MPRRYLIEAAIAADRALDDMKHAKNGVEWWVQRDIATKMLRAAIAKATNSPAQQ